MNLLTELRNPAIWAPLAVNAVFFVANVLWRVSLVRMESRLIREFVPEGRCKERREETERRLVQIGA